MQPARTVLPWLCPPEEHRMSQVMDPVCGMIIDSETAAGESRYEGRTYYFCGAPCKREFDANPDRYATRVAPGVSGDREVPLEKHEPPFTQSGGIVSPKFGSAGSGGAELEPGPERHG